MGRKIVILLFLASFGLAMFVYMSHERRSLRENLAKKTQREPRLVLEDFSYNRYQGEALTGRLVARLGHFYEPNVVELDGEIKGERIVRDGRETIAAESATAYFKASTLSKMMAETELDRAELTGFVEVGVRDHLMTTDYAEYLNAQEMVRSLRPVRVEGPGRVFSGEEGFTYALANEMLEMFGLVKGAYQPHEPIRP